MVLLVGAAFFVAPRTLQPSQTISADAYLQAFQKITAPRELSSGISDVYKSCLKHWTQGHTDNTKLVKAMALKCKCAVADATDANGAANNLAEESKCESSSGEGSAFAKCVSNICPSLLG